MTIPAIPAHGASWDAWAAGIDTAARGAVSSVVGASGAVTGTQIAADPALRAALVLPMVGGYTYNTDGTVASGPAGEAYAYNTDGTVHSVTFNGVTRVFSYNTDGTVAGAA